MNGNSKNVAQNTIIGIGGCGIVLLNYLFINNYLKGNWVAVDTDAQNLMKCLVPKRIQIGEKETRGLGTQFCVEVGRHAAEDAREELAAAFENRGRVYILSGLNGGTGLGATPVLCSLAKEAERHTTLFVPVYGSSLTEQEESFLEKWGTLVDEIQIWHAAWIPEIQSYEI